MPGSKVCMVFMTGVHLCLLKFEYLSPPSLQGRQIIRQKNKLFVGGLSADTKEEDLRSHFMQFGQVWA